MKVLVVKSVQNNEKDFLKRERERKRFRHIRVKEKSLFLKHIFQIFNSKTENNHWIREQTLDAYVMSSVLKLETIVLIKLSLMMTARIDFQSLAFSPSNKQIDSNASFTTAGGFAMERTSTKCCFFIDFTAIRKIKEYYTAGRK